MAPGAGCVSARGRWAEGLLSSSTCGGHLWGVKCASCLGARARPGVAQPGCPAPPRSVRPVLAPGRRPGPRLPPPRAEDPAGEYVSPTWGRWAVAGIDGCTAGGGGARGSCREGMGPLSHTQASPPPSGLGLHPWPRLRPARRPPTHHSPPSTVGGPQDLQNSDLKPVICCQEVQGKTRPLGP